MASTINAKNTSTGVVITPDASGQLELQTADITRMTIDVNGNVGVGTSSPTNIAGYKSLTVNGASSGLFSVEVNGVDSGYIYADSTSFSIDSKAATPNLSLKTNGTERMCIDSSGNVGIGTSSPSGRFDATNDQNAISRFYFRNPNTGSSAATFLNLSSNSSNTHGEIWVNGSNNTGLIGGANAMVVSNLLSAPLVFSTNNTERMRITSNGGVAFGGASNFGTSGQVLQSNGDAAPSWVTLFSSSIGTNGWARIGPTLIFQWGQVSAAANAATTVTLPITFPNAGLNVNSTNTANTNGGGSADWQGAVFLSTSQIQVLSGYDTARTFYWLAIGY